MGGEASPTSSNSEKRVLPRAGPIPALDDPAVSSHDQILLGGDRPASVTRFSPLTGEGGDSTILQQIRNQIERKKYYPLLARRSKQEGSPRLKFKLKEDGSIEYVVLMQSSGFLLLDKAAQQAVQEAAPYPFYPEPIALEIHYTLQ